MSTLESAVTRFLAHEADLLDRQALEEWLALFDPDGLYWIPAAPGQTDPHGHVSLAYESHILRTLRVRRWRNAAALSLQQAPRTVRHLSNLLITETPEDETVRATASVLVAEYAREALQHYHSRTTWTLRPRDGRFSIALKRVDLINCDGALSDILVVL